MLRLRDLTLIGLFALGLGACVPAEESTQDNNGGASNNGLPQGCDDAALAAMCPPGSQPLTGPDAFDACQGRGDVQITNGDGAISGVCQGQGACLVVCNLQDPCTCGIERIDTQGIFCVPCELAAACGNAICEGGEDPQSCPVDCAAQCTAGQGRCQGEDLQICQDNGSWQTLPCRSDQSCTPGQFSSGSAFCQTAVSPSGGTLPPLEPLPQVQGDSAQIGVLAAQLTCAGPNPTACETLGVVKDNKILAKGLRLFDPWSQEVETLTTDGSVGQGAQFSYSRDRAAWCSGRQVKVMDLNTGAIQNMKAFADDSIPLTCGAIAMNREGAVVAASMRLEDAPMVALWDAATGELLRLLRFADPELGVSQAAGSLGLDPGGRWLVECRDPDDRFQGKPLMILWNIEEGRYVRLLQFEGGCGRSVIRPGSFEVLQHNTLWDLESGQATWSLQGGQDVRGAVSPDGAVFALSWQRDCTGCTALVDADTGVILRRVGGTGERSFSEDGRYLMSGSNLYSDGTE